MHGCTYVYMCVCIYLSIYLPTYLLYLYLSIYRSIDRSIYINRWGANGKWEELGAAHVSRRRTRGSACDPVASSARIEQCALET